MKSNFAFQVSDTSMRICLPLADLTLTVSTQNLCGTVYRQGPVVFTPDGNSVLSPVGNRVSVFDLVK